MIVVVSVLAIAACALAAKGKRRKYTIGEKKLNNGKFKPPILSCTLLKH